MSKNNYPTHHVKKIYMTAGGEGNMKFLLFLYISMLYQ